MALYAVNERHALAKTLGVSDPASATLCGEWSAAQLAAHIVLRERSFVELLGRVPSKRLQDLAQREIDRLVASQPYEQIVADVAAGPSWSDARLPVPTALVWSLPPVRERANFLEYLVHHEDVRRARPGWQPRDLPADVQQEVWRRLPALTRVTMRSIPVGVALVWPGHGSVLTARARRRGVAVRVSGAPVELALFAFGRRSVAQVDLEGQADDLASLRAASLGI